MEESYTPLSDPFFQACLDQQQLLLWKERGINSENWILKIYVPSQWAL